MTYRTSRLTIGVGVGQDSVRVVALRRGRIAWAVERARGMQAVAQTIEAVLAEAPIPRWPRARVIVAVGPAHVQAKRLVGLPPVPRGMRLGDLVRESASRFFLRNGVPLVTTCRPSADGAPWAAAIEQPLLEAIETACRARRVRLAGVVPTVAVLGLAAGTSGEERVTWRDGDVRVALVFDARELRAVCRDHSASDTPPDAMRFGDLDVLGANGHRFADALGAARVRRGATLAWSGRDDGGAVRMARWRLPVAASAAALAIAAWLAAPGVAAQLAEREAAERLTRLGAMRRDVAYAERELAKVTAALSEVSAFDASRYALTPLLADFTRALPDESAIVTLNLRRDGGNLVALTPRAAALLTRLEALRGIEAVEIVGPVTREVPGGRVLERVTVRFRVNAAARRGAGAPSGSRS